MKFTSSIFQVTKKELYYQWYSNKIILLFLILLILSITHLVSLYGDVNSSYYRYKATENRLIENGIDTIEALKLPNDTYVEDNILVINNSLKEDYINLAIAIQSLKPQNIIGNTFEYLIFVFCTLLFGIYA